MNGASTGGWEGGGVVASGIDRGNESVGWRSENIIESWLKSFRGGSVMVGRLLDWTFMFDAIFYQTHHLNS